MEFSDTRPIYLQIKDHIIQEIIAGRILSGEKILPVREMALQLATNPNTVQRALQELEKEQILFSKRGLGRYVTTDQTILEQLNKSRVIEIIETYLRELANLGISAKDAVRLAAQYVRKESGDDVD